MSVALLHATAIAIGGNGVLLLGPSGSGKSDLALRLIDRGARLVSDDAVLVDCSVAPILKAAPNIEGRLEVRGVGICEVGAVGSAPLRLVVELCADIERLPLDRQTTTVCGFEVPSLRLAPFEISAPIKLEYALRMVVDAGVFPVASNAAALGESNRM